MWGWGSTTSSLVETSMEEVKLELGLPGKVTDWNFDRMAECTTECWLKSVWGYCCQWGLKLLDPTPTLPLRRDRDKHIMLAMLQSIKKLHPQPAANSEPMQVLPEGSGTG